jgi:hypothetical protein
MERSTTGGTTTDGFLNILDEGMRNIVSNAMDAATYQEGRMVFFVVVGVILVDIVTNIIIVKFSAIDTALRELKNERIDITQRSAPGAAGGSTTSIRSDFSSKPDVFDRGLTLGFAVWVAVPGIVSQECGMTWNETATHATLSLPVSPAMRKSLKCAYKESPEDPATTRVITLRWAGGRIVLQLSGLVWHNEMGIARVTGGFFRLPMKKVTPGKWGSLVAAADAAALNSGVAAPAKPAAPAKRTAAAQ